MKTCYVFLSEGVEEIEALTVVDLLRRDQSPVKMVSVDETEYVKGSHDILVKADCMLSEIEPAQACMLVLPGGMPGTTRLGASPLLTGAITDFAEKGKPVAAICAAPSILADLGLLKGKTAACHPSVEERLLEGGAELVTDPVVTDGNIITSRGMGTAIDFALALVKRCLGQAEADRIAAAIVYRADE